MQLVFIGIQLYLLSLHGDFDVALLAVVRKQECGKAGWSTMNKQLTHKTIKKYGNVRDEKAG